MNDDHRPMWSRMLCSIGHSIGRSLVPISALLIIGGTALWGPWVSLLLSVVWVVVYAYNA